MRDLAEVLAYLYPDHASIRRVTTFAGLDTGGIDIEGAALDVWAAILDAEIKRGRRGWMLMQALREFPDNPQLIPAGIAYLNPPYPWDETRPEFSRRQWAVMAFAALIVLWLLVLSVAAVIW